MFDTSFHQTLAPEAYLYGLPWKYFEELGVRRYGFTAPRIAMSLSGRRPCWRCRKRIPGWLSPTGQRCLYLRRAQRQSVDTSMGMTPLEGLMMGTRCGDVDFGAMAWIACETNQTLSDLERVVNKESGLLGISGLSSDLRVLERPARRS